MTLRPRDADVLIIGGGIAGWAAAYFAARAGRDVTLIDVGLHRASDLPIALVNPLRGKTGRLVPRGIEGTRASFALIDTLRDAGHRIEHGRGLFRPLIDVATRAREYDHWKALLPEDFAYEWHDAAPSFLGLAQPVPALHLREAGWVAPRDLLEALKSESHATTIVDEVVAIDFDPKTRAGPVSLASGPRITAHSLLWCGGAWGAARLDCPNEDNSKSDAIYKPGCLIAGVFNSAGSLVTTPRTLNRGALTFGLYAVPLRDGSTIIGPTREESQHDFPNDAIPDHAIARLQDRIAQVFGANIEVSSIWRGVRLVRMSSTTAQALRNVPQITALGSRGFLIAPLLAAEWARSL